MNGQSQMRIHDNPKGQDWCLIPMITDFSLTLTELNKKKFSVLCHIFLLHDHILW